MSRAVTSFDQSDLHSAALCAWKEARGEVATVGLVAIRAILHVIVNRALDWGQTVHQIIYGKNQFTSMSVPSDPEFNLAPAPDDPIMNQLGMITQDVLTGNDEDPTGGAHFYENPAESTPGGWFDRNIVREPSTHPFTKQIGKHRFYV